MLFRSPLPLGHHPGHADGLDLRPDIGFRELDGGDSVGVVSAAHVAYLMPSLLQRQDSAANESSHQVVQRELPVFLELSDVIAVSLDLGIICREVVPVVVLARGALTWGGRLILSTFGLAFFI